MGVAHDLIRALDSAIVPLLLSDNRGVPLDMNDEGTSQRRKERHNGIRLQEMPKMREEDPRSQNVRHQEPAEQPIMGRHLHQPQDRQHQPPVAAVWRLDMDLRRLRATRSRTPPPPPIAFHAQPVVCYTHDTK